ncbi:hypothetical protein [Chromobacterium sp. IIBBL 290-4]|uniref:hypothetical protein n=1 Tax=Chromobacterium sp. IIBBL 290-4 TaxID=2953890 RepID=UPI0020B77FE0|nr:hypothetical protein [Chromobacterium sp. IIBBL 290-4]UTH74389.1 hypothetical protein NKT35_23085 [Chromobacterium sp. IIBBL 290-4]
MNRLLRARAGRARSANRSGNLLATPPAHHRQSKIFFSRLSILPNSGGHDSLWREGRGWLPWLRPLSVVKRGWAVLVAASVADASAFLADPGLPAPLRSVDPLLWAQGPKTPAMPMPLAAASAWRKGGS